MTVLVENESYIYSPELGVVYMGGGAGRLPGRDVFYPGFKNCLYERWDGTFFILGLKTVYMGGGTGRLPGRDEHTLQTDTALTTQQTVPV